MTFDLDSYVEDPPEAELRTARSRWKLLVGSLCVAALCAAALGIGAIERRMSELEAENERLRTNLEVVAQRERQNRCDVDRLMHDLQEARVVRLDQGRFVPCDF